MAAHDVPVGPEGLPVETLAHDRMTAVLSRLPLVEYGAEAQQSSVTDLGWVDRAVTTHAAEDDLIAAVATTVPLCWGTIGADDDEPRSRLHAWQVAPMQVLDRVDGCQEWRARIFSRDGNLDSFAPAGALTRALHDALSRFTVATRHLPIDDARLSTHGGVRVHNAAYLMPAQLDPAFSQRLHDLPADIGAQDPTVVIDGHEPQPVDAFAIVERS